ncbi:phosphotransferase family protein [Alkalibacillus aidingensis]|uniref:phosphotransferase family protein n=1 Tax=Alkalibacillus aidingensis TaxID=2747607 RepID=UPI00166082C9|nr:phosphotransferase family protein [Alkalibacillus aidingensis]
MTTSQDFVDHKYINWELFEQFLRESVEGLPDKLMDVKKFSEGYSNQTYLIQVGEWEGVMRRPPFGEIPPKAHDMEREHNLLKKINQAFDLAPKPYVYSEGNQIMDKHFYIMEKKNGIVIDEKIPSWYGKSEDIGGIISDQVIETMVKMQAIDYRKANLEGIGKPNGYLERQVHGWIKRFNRSKTDDVHSLEQLEQWFVNSMPTTKESTIVHNDFKLNNIVLDEKVVGKVNGIIDWELSTIGDPMTDLGSTVAYWGEAGDPDLGINVVTDQPGFYSRRDFLSRYAEKSGRDLSEITFYVAFGFYKLAGILQQIYYRWKIGELKDNRFKELNHSINNLLEMAELTSQNRLL